MSDRVVPDDSIAVVGMAGRFPGAPDVSAFWRNLRGGVESIRHFSDEELLAGGTPPAVLQNSAYVKAGAILKDIEAFDASFFGYLPRDAAVTDPQQRLFLECAWEALESAGYDPQRYPGRVGVYGGVSISTYRLINLTGESGPVRSMSAFQTSIGNDKDYLATRVSYRLNLRGPSVTVQTACSTSLVAVHLACQSLLVGQSDLALAGGSSICLPQPGGYWYQEGGITSRDGHCRAYDERAEGTVPGSGVGVVVLKRLGEAERDGDVIRAVIRGSAINNDGWRKVGYTAPSVEGQAEVIAEALALAGVEARTVGYVEGHGTGTALGDPIEVRALGQVYGESSGDEGWCVLGSVKTNIGHLDAASGVAGLMKAVLALEHGEIPGTLHFERGNPECELEGSPFRVSRELEEWRRGEWPRRAGVSSFGIGGTNAHVVLEEAPERESSGESRPWQLLLVSGRSEWALERAKERLAEHLEGHEEQGLADVAYTLQVGRRRFEHRTALVCERREEALSELRKAGGGRYEEERERPVAFMFPAQGSQHVRMGEGLYREEPVFRGWLDRCSELLERELGLDLRSRLYPAAGDEAAAAVELGQIWLAQPAQFAVSYALARTLMEWGLEPVAMIGHSLGEYVAACLAGVFTLEDGLRLVSCRGRLMQGLPEGAMLGVGLGAEELEGRLGGLLSLAAVNGPRQCVVSGPVVAVERLEAELKGEDVACRRLHVPLAAHSAMQDPIVGPYVEEVRRVELREPVLPYVSNLSGELAGEEVTRAKYWGRQLREPVQFERGLRRLLERGESALVEVGPGTSLGSLVRQQVGAEGRVVVSAMRHPEDGRPDRRHLMEALGALWVSGVAIDWERYARAERRRRVILPTYPFERERYWIEARPDAADGSAEPAVHGTPGVRFWIPSWRRSLRPRPAGRALFAGERLRWLVLADPHGVGNGLARRLEALGQEVVAVTQGRWSVEDLPPELPDRIVHCRNVGPPRELDGELPAVLSVSQLVDAVGSRPGGASSVVVVSSGTQEVAGAEELTPVRAVALAADVAARYVDIPVDGDVADAVLAELEAPSTDLVVAYRGGHRWVRRWEPLLLDADVLGTARLRERGVYLVSGPLDEMAMAVASLLAQRLRARLVLWDSDARGARQRLEALGAEVEVTDPASAEAAVERTLKRFGEIHGIVHVLAGTSPSLHEDDGASIRRCLEMDRCAAALTLDFRLLLSTAGSPLAQFAGTFARWSARRSPASWASISWYASTLEAPPGAAGDSLALTAEQTWEALRRVLSVEPVPEVVISTRELPAVLPPPMRDRSGRPRAYAGPRDDLEQTIAAVWQQHFGVDRIGVDENFFGLGGHSLLAIHLVADLRARLDAPVAIRAIFEHPTIEALARALAEQRRQQDAEIEAMLADIESLSPEQALAALIAEGGTELREVPDE